jgi:hypothetical protein
MKTERYAAAGAFQRPKSAGVFCSDRSSGEGKGAIILSPWLASVLLKA